MPQLAAALPGTSENGAPRRRFRTASACGQRPTKSVSGRSAVVSSGDCAGLRLISIVLSWHCDAAIATPEFPITPIPKRGDSPAPMSAFAVPATLRHCPAPPLTAVPLA